MSDDDPFRLQRFVEAQAPVYENVLAELGRARKQTHWMWFIFPQIEGLGHSVMAQTYAVGSLAEAQAYLVHPVLGARLKSCTQLVLTAEGKSLHAIFGSPDDLKFHSCMTLFARASGNADPFRAALHKFFRDAEDQATLQRLR